MSKYFKTDNREVRLAYIAVGLPVGLTEREKRERLFGAMKGVQKAPMPMGWAFDIGLVNGVVYIHAYVQPKVEPTLGDAEPLGEWPALTEILASEFDAARQAHRA